MKGEGKKKKEGKKEEEEREEGRTKTESLDTLVQCSIYRMPGTASVLCLY